MLYSETREEKPVDCKTKGRGMRLRAINNGVHEQIYMRVHFSASREVREPLGSTPSGWDCQAEGRIGREREVQGGCASAKEVESLIARRVPVGDELGVLLHQLLERLSPRSLHAIITWI